MNLQETRNRQVLGLFLLSVLVSFVVLNRWLVVDAGLRSYGRVWQLYISYEDFGFIRRGLFGTIFSVSKINSIFENEYHFSIFAHHVAILVLAVAILVYIKRSRIDDVPLIATVFLSPALIIQSGYTTGSLDVFILVLITLNILYVRTTATFALVLVMGILAHELFVFTIPAQLVSHYMSLKAGGEQKPREKLMIPIIATIAAITVVSIFGSVNFPRSYVESIMAEKLPYAAGQHSLWSGYFETSATAAENTSWSVYAFFKELRHAAVFLLIPLLYLVLVTARLISYSKNKLERLVFVLSALCPLLVSFLAADLYRWIGMSANVGLLLTLSILERETGSRSKITFVLLPFSLLAPFGAAQIDRPFPAQQLIWESLFG
ncbi:hypothetical protein ACOXXX_19920 [Thalassococcus sp. BH17M4-6]|uniref:hypothetical protein n=1 Tax=Thalassococcus sp. BH17M4-6 TaxID=3413148 RepID=UPI003BE728CA